MAFFPQCMYAPHSPLSSPLFFQGGRVRFSNNRESTGVISLRSAGDISLPQRGPPRRGLIVPQQPPNPPTIIPLTHARWVSPLRKFGFPGGQWPVVDCHYYLQLSLWPKGRHRCEGGALINKTRPLEWAVMIWQIQLPNLNPKPNSNPFPHFKGRDHWTIKLCHKRAQCGVKRPSFCDQQTLIAE